jgi:hypothetical protein
MVEVRMKPEFEDLWVGMSNILTAHKDKTVGSKIIDNRFWAVLEQAIKGHAFPENGQAYIPLPEAIPYVSSGVARRADVPLEGYHIVSYREGPSLYVDRKYAAPVDHLAVVVYTKEAYAIDPDCTPEEVEAQEANDYVLVAVLASSGPKAPLSAYRFVHNLAGGNNEFKPENGYTLEKAIEKAKEIVAYGRDWITVADRV